MTAPPSPQAVPPRRFRRGSSALATLGCAVLVLALAGCGSSSHADGTEADPSTAVPAAAPLYLGATVRPSGSEASGALAAGKALTGSANPYQRLLGALRTPGSPALDYKSEVAPWLGPHAGLFLASLSSAEALLGPLEKVLTGSGQVDALDFSKGHLDGALVMDTSDASAARSFLAGQAKRAGAHATSYRGVSYEVGSAGVAFGLVGRFAVIGSEAALREVIGATQGESALRSASAYGKLAASAPSGAIGHIYVNPQAAGALSGASAHAGLLALLGGERPANVSLLASSGSLALDVDTLAHAGTSGGLLSADPESTQALSELPGDSWLALGLGHAASTLPADVAGLQALGGLLGGEESASAAISLGSLLGGITKPLSILAGPSARARADYRSWMGSAAVFAAGSSVLELKAAVVFSSKDPSRSRAAVGKLAAAMRAAGDEVAHASITGTEAAMAVRLPGVPLELEIAAGPGPHGSEFVLGLGEASVQAALAPTETLATAPSRSAAATALGEGIPPSALADLPTLLALLESVGLTEDPSLATLLPYLRATTTVAGGGHSLGGEVERFRLVLGLHQAG